jgi:hypothetical protein
MAGSVTVIEPENEAPLCVICHVIVPGPEESDAVPVHVPVRLGEPDGVEGVSSSPPEHAATPATTRIRMPRTQDP